MHNDVGVIFFALLMPREAKIDGEGEGRAEDDEGEVGEGQDTVADAHEVHCNAANNLGRE